MTNTFLNYKAATLFLLSIFPWIQKTLCIICFCEKHCSENQSSGSCEVKSGGHCFVAVKNIWEPEKGEYIQQWTSGCLSSKKIGCIAADIQGTGTWTQMLLITDYHENGSLFEYLQAKILDKTALLKICLSMAAGIAYLHTEIFGTPGKPALAHRDIKSKNILIKRNGECAIADFGLAVRFSSKSGTIDAVSDIRVGTRRYMAPEVLDQTLDVTSFNAFKMADVYSMGLVLWEACRRCTTDFRTSVVDFYSLPYQDVVPSNPSFEDMKLVVCVKRLRPPMPTRWESDTVLYSLRQTILECWHQVPGVRLTALRVKKTLSKLYINNLNNTIDDKNIIV
ncbi:bone morphogenetic protein receptor type-1A isoform X3 [Cephus cinctus]|uniref:receptor protein serine/threonine kinase n=1 Tax=Cephus cinctus TaxID=211228 RepID=A0AAJ7RD29_CEPCN|nr:bone morphogenetic protein receptor type-1A isoform X3 [Cephus cinctus]